MNSHRTTVEPCEIAKFEQHASQWWDKNGPFKTLHDINQTRLEFIETIQPLRGLKVLDLGCGGGILAEAMTLRGAQVTGLDAAPWAIEAARQHANQGGLVIDYVCEKLEDYEAPTFDAIVCMEMLEHVTDPRLIIEHAARLLAPEGYLFLSTIHRTLQAYLSVVVVAEYLLNLLPRQTHDFEKFIKPSELASMVRDYGFEVLALKGMSYHPWTRQAKLVDSVAANYLLCCRRTL